MPRSLETDLDAILGSLARAFVQEGDARGVALLAYSAPTIENTTVDGWNGGTYGYTIYLSVPPHLFVQLDNKEKELEILLKDRFAGLARLYENQFVEAFVIHCELPQDGAWREKAKAWLTGEGVSNQGRARSTNVAPILCDGLLFRSEPEIQLYRALRSAGVSFAPLPVFVRGGREYRRIEPDFFIVKDGIALVIEVDGATVHQESPQEAHNRITMLLHEGVHIERVNANECDTPEKAKVCANKILAIIQKLKTNK